MGDKLRVRKKWLRDRVGLEKGTFLNELKILCSDPQTPFSYEDIKRGHFIKRDWAKYILNNL